MIVDFILVLMLYLFPFCVTYYYAVCIYRENMFVINIVCILFMNRGGVLIDIVWSDV